MLNEKVKNLFNSFRLRKRILAATDAFIVVAAAGAIALPILVMSLIPMSAMRPIQPPTTAALPLSRESMTAPEAVHVHCEVGVRCPP